MSFKGISILDAMRCPAIPVSVQPSNRGVTVGSSAMDFPQFKMVDLNAFYRRFRGAGPEQIGVTFIPPMNSMKPIPPRAALLPKIVQAQLAAKAKVRAASDLPRNFSWTNSSDVQMKNAKLPSNFLLGPPNQQKCGSCWAMSSVTALGDRWAIQKAVRSPLLSTKVVCGCSQSNCCDGGLPDNAGHYFEDVGVPLDSCWPYAQFCAGDSSECNTCQSAIKVPECVDKSKPLLWKARRGTTYLLTSATEPTESVIRDNIDRIKLDVYNNGPVIACYWVYSDFFAGKWPLTNNVYIHEGGQLAGGHAVTIVGWGETDVRGKMIPYWLARNSWDVLWGEGGYFKFAMGLYNPDVGFDHVVKTTWGLLGGVYRFEADPMSGERTADDERKEDGGGGVAPEPSDGKGFRDLSLVAKIISIFISILILFILILLVIFIMKKIASNR